MAARLCDHISICADELPAADAPPDPAFATHAEAEFNGLALVLFARQFAHNPPYRIFCEARGALPAEISRWAEIPAVPAALFKEFEFSCLTPEQRTRLAALLREHASKQEIN